MTRKFGVELEVIGINAASASQAINAAGITCNAESYNHLTRPTWKVVHDGSLRDSTGRGSCEVVSPVLEGEAGLAEVTTVCNALKSAGALINTTCGLHVHIDASGLSTANVKSIVRRYVRFEAEIDGFMAPSRRANHFCQSNQQDMLFIESASTISDAANRLQNRFATSARYRKVNLQSYLRHGTVEFRQHGGSVEAAKVTNWIKFLQGFVAASCGVNGGACSLPERNWRGNAKVIREYIRNGNAHRSVEEVYSAVAALLPDQTTGAARVKTVIREQIKMANAANTDSLFAGVEESLASYYRNRAQRFSAPAAEVRAAA